MRKLSAFIILLALIVVNVSVGAQNMTASPSSRYGLGQLNDNVPNTYRALGGVGLGMRSNKVIDPSQPASYTASDSLTFMFDVAASVMWSHYKDASGSRNRGAGNLEYLTMQFPLWRRYIALSLGVLPYSSVGYSFAQADSVGTHSYGVSYYGEGGITQVYGGLSFNICDWVALGANIYYMFGSLSNFTALTFAEEDITGYSMVKTMSVSSLRFRYGMQLFHTFDKHTVVLGGIFENKRKLNGQYNQYEINTLDSINNRSDGFETPMEYGAGVSYTFDRRLTVGLNYLCQEWGDVLYFGERGNLHNRSKVSAGVEYRHSQFGRNYAERMIWRVGGSITDSYAQNNGWRDFSVSVGLGFPLRNSGTIFNASLEYEHTGTPDMLNENALRLTINASISENWFFKRKL